MTDPGLEVVEHVFSVMRIDREWSVREKRGFTWWGKDFAQRVWVEPPFEDEGFQISRVHARTDLLRGVEASPGNIAGLNAGNGLASMSGMIFDSDQHDAVQLAASVYVHRESLEGVKRLFSLAVAIQAADAQLTAQELAESMSVQPASSAHPSSGPRQEADDMMNVLAGCIVPAGEANSTWVGEDFASALRMLQQPPCLLATGDKQGLTAEFPFKGRTSLLRVTTSEAHPQLGHGLLLRFSLPCNFSSADEANRVALGLNEMELRSLTRAHFLGSWCNGPPGATTVTYVSFYPNMAYQPGLLPTLVMSTMLRARWVAEEVFGDDWSETFPNTLPACGRLAGLLRALGLDSRRSET